MGAMGLLEFTQVAGPGSEGAGRQRHISTVRIVHKPRRGCLSLELPSELASGGPRLSGAIHHYVRSGKLESHCWADATRENTLDSRVRGNDVVALGYASVHFARTPHASATGSSAGTPSRGCGNRHGGIGICRVGLVYEKRRMTTYCRQSIHHRDRINLYLVFLYIFV